MNPTAQPAFATEELYLSAYLLSKRVPLSGTVLRSDNRVEFRFEDTPQVRERILDYMSNQDYIQDFIQGLREAKRRIRQMTVDEAQENKKGGAMR